MSLKPETRVCQNCKTDFIIESEDFEFYEKMGVTVQTWCSNCQLQKRLTFRNERSLHKRKCDAPGHAENIISVYALDSGVVVYDQKYWWGDGWDAGAYAHDYDFNRPFFEQIHDLIKKVPWSALYNMNAIASEYCNYTTDNKNCYLVFGGDFNENCSYSGFSIHCRDSMDLYFASKCELCYSVIDSDACYRVMFSQYSKDCSDSVFLYNCLNCQNCFGCVGLKNKSYCIFNEQYSKEEYAKKIKEFDLGNPVGLAEAKAKFTVFKKNSPTDMPKSFIRLIARATIFLELRTVKIVSMFQDRQKIWHMYSSVDGISKTRETPITWVTKVN